MAKRLSTQLGKRRRVDGGDADDHDRKVAIFRTGRVLEEAVHELQQLLLRSRNIGLRTKARGANPELVIAYRVQKMLKLALCVAYGAYTRTESSGAHFPRGLPAPQRRRVAEPRLGDVEV
jgi:succinate dehydrogenase/fumarate reductase flavoprotein subunit